MRLTGKARHLEYEDLIREGKLRIDETVRKDHVQKLIGLAYKDLETSKYLIEKELGAALIILYNAAFRATNAMVRSQGFRPGRRQQHIGVMEAVKRNFDKSHEETFAKIDALRIHRNDFKYRGVLAADKQEVLSFAGDVKRYLDIIVGSIRKKSPGLLTK